jgi:hypothetical protein
MKKYLSAFVLLGAGMMVGIPQVLAETASEAKAVKKAPKKVVAAAAEDDAQPDVVGHTRVDYNCELGNKVSIYENSGDEKHIALRWNKKMHELTRVSTTTGAHRFENKDAGLVWINIPAKGMLLDSKKGQQLANDCKSPSQTKAKKTSA